PSLNTLPILQARGELYTIGEQELAFDADEVGALFESVEGRALSSADATAIYEQTGGLPIAIQLLGRPSNVRTFERLNVRTFNIRPPNRRSHTMFSSPTWRKRF